MGQETQRAILIRGLALVALGGYGFEVNKAAVLWS
jgi:hypothetical protein